MSQSLSNILVHIVFSTKDRFPFLLDFDLRKRMHAYLAGAFNDLSVPAIEVGGVGDHVHILCRLPRNHSVSEILNKAKSNSSAWAKNLGGMCAKFSWQSGYGAFSVGQFEVCSLQTYIQNQAEHHRHRTFQEEYLEFLRQFQIDYDERYIWT